MSGGKNSLRGLAWVLHVRLDELVKLAENPEPHYRPFVSHRRGKSPRAIDQPVGRLKEVQRRIRTVFLADQPLDEGVRACVVGGSPYKNADVHRNQPNFARVDVKNCYPSITNRMVYETFQSLGFGGKEASLLTRLTTRGGHLPQGAPTSDMIANLYLRPVDARLREIAASANLERSRCMDDIAVSGHAGTRDAIGQIIEVIRELGLAVRHKKTKHSGPGRPHVATGFTVNGPWGPKVVKAKVQQIRSVVHEVVLAHRRGEPVQGRLPSITGSLAYLRRTNPGVVRRLERQLAITGIVVTRSNTQAAGRSVTT